MKNRACSAFTLIELLIVIAIVATLAAIVLPVYGSVQMTSRRTQSMSNLRQLTTGTLAYSGDHNGNLPQQGDATTWASAATNTAAENDQWYNTVLTNYANSPSVSDYAKNPAAFYQKGSLFYVPAAPYSSTKLAAPQFAVAFNSKLETSGYTNVSLQMIQAPTETVLYLETGVLGEKPLTGQKAYTAQPYSYASRAAARYGGKMILTFCDGHADAFTATDIVSSSGKAYFPPKDNASVYWSEQTSVNPGS